jgi:hypothetical protein
MSQEYAFGAKGNTVEISSQDMGSKGENEEIHSNHQDHDNLLVRNNSLDINEEKYDKKNDLDSSQSIETKRTSEQRSVQSSKKTDFSMYVNRIAGK